MSSGETAIEPSPIDGTGSSGLCTPSLCAIVRDVLGADVDRQLREDGVVGLDRRLLDR